MADDKKKVVKFNGFEQSGITPEGGKFFIKVGTIEITLEEEDQKPKKKRP